MVFRREDRERHPSQISQTEKWIDPSGTSLLYKLFPKNTVKPTGYEVGMNSWTQSEQAKILIDICSISSVPNNYTIADLSFDCDKEIPILKGSSCEFPFNCFFAQVMQEISRAGKKWFDQIMQNLKFLTN